MNVVKRLTLIVFSLCGAFSLAALALPWLGPWTRQATALLSQRWYYLALEIALTVTALGLLAALLCALFSPRRRKVVEAMDVGGDTIAVACSAISSQARHIVEQGGRYTAERVWVHARKRSVRVVVRVRPQWGVDVPKEGPVLRDALLQGVSMLVGDAVEGVDLEFVDPGDGYGDEGFVAYDLQGDEGDTAGATDARPHSDTGPGTRDEIAVPLGQVLAGGVPSDAEEA